MKNHIDLIISPLQEEMKKTYMYFYMKMKKAVSQVWISLLSINNEVTVDIDDYCSDIWQVQSS